MNRKEKTEWRFPLDEERKEQGLHVIRRTVACSRIRSYPSFMENVWSQMRFQSWTHWLLEGGILLAAMLLAFWLCQDDTNPVELFAACSAFLVFAGNLCLSGVADLFSWHMAELEQTLYLSLKQMLCIRMLEAGIADLAVLAVFAGVTGGGEETGIGVYLLYMLVPFLWSDILYLRMLMFFRSVFSGARQIAMGALCAIFACFPAMLEYVYEPEYVPVWCALSIAGLLFLIMEIYEMFGKIEKGDQICLN